MRRLSHAFRLWCVPLSSIRQNLSQNLSQVSRPLFIEEHGLRLLLDNEGVGVELSRDSYEAGEWAHAVQDAFIKGRTAKVKKREEMAAGVGADMRAVQGKKMAASVVAWVNDCWRI